MTGMTQMRSIKRNLQLAWDLAHRDLASRFKKSSAGALWLVITPVSFAAIYWLVFSCFMKLEWIESSTGTKVPYIAPLFAGLATYLFFSDTITGSLSVFRSKREYVRRAAVPLWVLWLALFFRVAVGGAISYFILLVLAAIYGLLTVSAILSIPIALALISMAGLSISLLLSLLGAFFSDLEEGARIVLRVLFYTAPITYPISIVPAKYVGLIWSNPLTALVEIVRNAFVFSALPPAVPSVVLIGTTTAILLVGVWLYSRVRGVISDVV